MLKDSNYKGVGDYTMDVNVLSEEKLSEIQEIWSSLHIQMGITTIPKNFGILSDAGQFEEIEKQERLRITEEHLGIQLRNIVITS